MASNALWEIYDDNWQSPWPDGTWMLGLHLKDVMVREEAWPYITWQMIYTPPSNTLNPDMITTCSSSMHPEMWQYIHQRPCQWLCIVCIWWIHMTYDNDSIGKWQCKNNANAARTMLGKCCGNWSTVEALMWLGERLEVRVRSENNDSTRQEASIYLWLSKENYMNC